MRQNSEESAASPMEVRRNEAKYFLDRRRLEDFRRFLGGFCRGDACAAGEGYTVTTCYLDNPALDLYKAKERKAVNRFKLRIRSYGEPGDAPAPVFVEIKRKFNQTIVKSRAVLPPGFEDLEALLGDGALPEPASADPAQRDTLLEFRRLANEIGARPTMMVRYRRESYESDHDGYGRVSVDTRLRYRETRRLRWPREGARWRVLETGTVLRRSGPVALLELKSTVDVPAWMIEAVRRFDLVRGGFCKYAAAMRLESLFMGYAYSSASENCSYA